MEYNADGSQVFQDAQQIMVRLLFFFIVRAQLTKRRLEGHSCTSPETNPLPSNPSARRETLSLWTEAIQYRLPPS